jgi:hypothetical protein
MQHRTTRCTDGFQRPLLPRPRFRQQLRPGVVELDSKVVGVLQLTYIPYITYRGSWRALIEGVRVDSSLRASGIGRKLLTWAV